MLEVQGLTKRFGTVTAVEDFSLAAAGETVALLGPSGCGKTTVLRIVAGLERPDRGRVLLAGRDATDWPPERRGVGLVFQSYALFPHLSVAGNVAYGLRFRRGVDRRSRVGELLELVGLRGYERRKPHQLSAGQQQRVALARALAPEPTLLLLDEPLSALDAALRKNLRGELRALLAKFGVTAVYVTHDQEEALALADRVAVMRDGRLEQVAAPADLYNRPRTPFVATFLGRANLWPGKVVSVDGDRSLVEVAGESIPALRGEAQQGDEVFLFFRPEWVQVGEGPYTAEVESAEYLGDRWELHARFRGLRLTLLSSREARAGSTVSFTIPAAQTLPLSQSDATSV